ncbi:MAG: DUF899 domain-containing protein [Chloroflexi bacterium]|nr:DUF899 domain-containing protein [Chloroflexota bacterium]
MTADAVGEAQFAAAMADLEKAKQRLVELRRRMPAEPVEDYELTGPDGSVKLSAMFGDRSDLILIHNMGAGCPYCTMWADGFNGVLQHLESRAAFVVVSPDAPEVQQRLVSKRDWRFRMYSAQGTAFIEDMGFGSEEEHYDSHAMPGVSVFHKNPDGAIVRVARDFFGPGDLYCGVWHLFDLLQDGPGDWAPQFQY